MVRNYQAPLSRNHNEPAARLVTFHTERQPDFGNDLRQSRELCHPLFVFFSGQQKAEVEKERAPEHVPERVLERAPEHVQERVHERDPEHVLELGPEHDPEHVSERVLERVQERVHERGSERVHERGLDSLLVGFFRHPFGPGKRLA
ncbi:MAG: hypothetical protein COT91_04110 [Candidatus Doudnabacteria bacterium CG10_big_fil_rev_8_21_14_0_10_41_10]|uniref:Uncharacterized protein n=1 Tax=Candidatus Doudnabacteria bacterium CG10_big_fil_rev_8_21_14_0_10_41_10 TaxID=1974551 RepID=A0A2H0VCV0_9BACT|nr:MAG: hypothetical protein COT91_04110 [Candidatus Doudnabacteria bacterium CG10_big_fil_rev_8_21_14_0_10_41_10]